ncbi:MAG: hypothetical protein AB7K86_06785 [Rhodospirillales bacterium]
MRLTLVWQGPVGAGSFPDDPEGFAALMVPAVYLRVKAYRGGRTVSYVGQSRTLLARIDQHIGQMLALAAPLRDDDGRPAYGADPVERLSGLNRGGALPALAAAEALRMRFYFAACGDDFPEDCLSLAEAALKDRLEAEAGRHAGLVMVENRMRIPFAALDAPLEIASTLDALAAGDAAVVAALIGDAPIRLGAVEEAFDGA